jgi:alkaline phosphatase
MIRMLGRSIVNASLPGALAFLLAAGGPASAAPASVSVSPPAGARFLPGQRFDLRVEGAGTGPFSATLAIDGVAQTFTSGMQGSMTTDDITRPGFGGFNRRGYSSNELGKHLIEATFTDVTGTVAVTSGFEVVAVGGRHRQIKNIIIMLGDGMGVSHRTAARIARFGVTGGDPNDYLEMDKFPATGLVTTHSLNSIITDSAPGMSGYVTGNHQNNNQEGVFPANVVNPFLAPRVEYLSEYLHRVQGKSLGLVSTADLEDATPAANAVHTLLRGNGTGIVDQYLDEADPSGTGSFGTGLRVLLGGGRRWFLPAGQFGSSRADATDYGPLPPDLLAGWSLPSSAAGALDAARDLAGAFVGAGFRYVTTATELASASGRSGKLLGLFTHGNMNVALDKLAKRRGVLLPGATSFVVDDYHAPDQPMLDEMTRAAVAVLARERNGFVLMVEGAHIDKQSHAMDADRVIDETIEFDRAVGVARRFAQQERDTLVIVLADHECSGFSIIGALSGGIANLQGLPPDSAVLDPAVQPARQKVVGVYDAAAFPRYVIAPDGYPETLDIDGKLLIGYGASADRYEGWLTRPLPIIDSLLPAEVKTELAGKGYPAAPSLRAERTSGFFLRGQAAGADQAVHTAADIPVSAYSADREVALDFTGVQTNTDVFFKLARAVFGGR